MELITAGQCSMQIFSMSLEEAQKNKHKFIADKPGHKGRIKGVGYACGWGPFLRYIKERVPSAQVLHYLQGKPLPVLKMVWMSM
jgi:hypothetical protein